MATNPALAICAGCGAPVMPGARFCGGCGKPVAVGQGHPPMPPPRPMPPPMPPVSPTAPAGPNARQVPLAVPVTSAPAIVVAAIGRVGGTVTSQGANQTHFTMSSWGNRFKGRLDVIDAWPNGTVASVWVGADWGYFAMWMGATAAVGVVLFLSVGLMLLSLVSVIAAVAYSIWSLSGPAATKQRERVILALQEVAVASGGFGSPRPSPAEPRPVETTADQLRALAAEHRAGTLSDADFAAAKARLLARLH